MSNSPNKMDVSITIKLESGPQFQLSSPTRESVSNEIHELAKKGCCCPLPGTNLIHTIPAFANSHILVETGAKDSEVVVYGVACENNGCLSPQQVAKRVFETFGVVISENLTSESPPESLQGEPVYLCGSLLKWESNSNTPAWSNRQQPPSVELQATQRPVHLPISALETANTNRSNRNGQALVAGGFTDQHVLISEDNTPADGFRHTAVPLPTAVQHILPTATKIQPQDLASLPIGDINLETPDQRAAAEYMIRPKIQLTVANDDAPSPVKASKEESEPRLLSQPENVSSMMASRDKHPSNQLVVGIGHRRQISGAPSLPPPKKSLARQLSLPGEAIKAVITRNASEDCLARLPHSQAAEVPLNISPLSPGTKPLAVQRQESEEMSGQMEFVMPKAVNLVMSDPETPAKESNLPILNEDAPEVPVFEVPSAASMDSAIVDQPSISQLDDCENEVVFPLSCDDYHDNEDARASPVPNHTQRVGSDSSTGVTPVHSNDPGESEQVHIMEHAVNDRCEQTHCKIDRAQEFHQAMDQMNVMIDEVRNGRPIDEHLKNIIHKHCGRCKDPQCKIPHIMAGCSPPGVVVSSSDRLTCSDQPTSSDERTSSDESTNSCNHSPQQCEISIDQEFYQSTTSEVERHKKLHPVETIDSPVPGSPVQTAPFSPAMGRQLRQVPGSIGFGAVSPMSTKPHLPELPAGSPVMMSGGFPIQPTGPQTPTRGHHYQESQLGAKSYIHQVSDKGNRNALFHMPSNAQNGLRKIYGNTANKRPRVAKKGEFPSYGSFPPRPGMIVYSTDESELTPGQCYPCPHTVPEKDKLGKGGNGEVIMFPLGGTVYALKKTTYREYELNVWSMLDHPNILPLRGVMLGEASYCYQFMTKLTGDLRSMMTNMGDLCTLLKKQPEEWPVVIGNTMYILEKVLEALVYLEKENIQHSDLKAQNVLIDKKCSCLDIWHCTCPVDKKFLVKLADFDSMKRTKYSRNAERFSDICPDFKNQMDMGHVKGTPAYRAPEQFTECGKKPEYKKELSDGKVLFDLEGPWCDIWSFGVVVLQIVLGSHSKQQWINEASILTNTKAAKMSASIEAPVAIIRLNELLELSDTQPELKPLAKIASACLKICLKKRSSASDILQILHEQASALPTFK